jgi:hypothetical protein
MNEPYPGGPGGGNRPYPGGRRQLDQPDLFRRDDDQYRPQHGQQRGPEPRNGADEPGRGRHHRDDDSRRPDPDWTPDWNPDRTQGRTLGRTPGRIPDRTSGRTPGRTKALALRATSLDLNATSVDLPAVVTDLPERRAGRNWTLIAGAAFFLLDTVLMVDGFFQPAAVGSRVLVIFIWLISLAAIALLWLRISPASFQRNPLIRLVLNRLTRVGARTHPGSRDAIAR